MRISFITILIASMALLAFNRDDPNDLPQKLFDKFSKYTSSFPQEKIYLHTDRSYYAAGSDVWFKAYVLDAGSFQSSQISKILHAELIAPSGRIVQAHILGIDSGSAVGDFELPLNLPEGRYLIRAYTNWMQNFGNDFFFKKEIEIFDPQIAGSERGYSFGWRVVDQKKYLEADIDLQRLLYDSLNSGEFQYSIILNNEVYEVVTTKSEEGGKGKVLFRMPGHLDIKSMQIGLSARDNEWEYTNSITVPLADQEIDLQFFPEGGYMVTGIESKLAFKAINEFGKGVDIEGEILDQNQKKVGSFRSFHKGMGYFLMKPQPGQLYYAKVDGLSGEILYQLPEATPQSIVMSIDNSVDDVVKIRIRSRQEAEGESGYIVLVAQSRSSITFMAKSEVGSYFETEIPKSRFPSGITQFTVFDGNGEPKLERLIFVDHKEKLRVSIASDKTSYAPREKIRLEVTTASSEGHPIEADLALTVVDAQEIKQHFANQENIYSYLLLSSDLTGRIEEPNYYFTEDPKAKEALDILMLTQGWRRFVWKEILADTIAAPRYLVEQNLMVRGTLLKSYTTKPSTGGEVILLYTGAAQGIATSEVNDDGRFSFDGSRLFGDINMIFQGRNKKGKPYVDVILDTARFQAPLEWIPSAIEPDFNQKIAEFLAGSKTRRQADLAYNFDADKVLDEVIIRGQKIPDEKDRRSGQIYGSPTNRINVADIPGAENLQNALYLLYRVPGVRVNPDPFNPSVLIRGIGTINSGTSPLFLIDGAIVNIQAVANLPVSTIETIDVLKGPAASIFGARGSNGVIAVYTKQGLGAYGESRGITHHTFQGFYRAREFYAPKYDQQLEEHVKPDLRASLYWNPSVRTNSEGKAIVEFYNADKTTTFRANAQGVSSSGQVGGKNYTFRSAND